MTGITQASGKRGRGLPICHVSRCGAFESPTRFLYPILLLLLLTLENPSCVQGVRKVKRGGGGGGGGNKKGRGTTKGTQNIHAVCGPLLEPDPTKRVQTMSAAIDCGQALEETRATTYKAAERRKVANYHYRIAEILETEGIVKHAIRHLDLASKADPRYPDPHFLRGRLLAMQQDYTKAQQAYQSALSIDQTVGAFHLGLALVSQSAGDLDTAIAHFNKVIELDRIKQPGNVALAYHHRGDCQRRQGKFSAAIDSMQQAIDLAAKAPVKTTSSSGGGGGGSGVKRGQVKPEWIFALGSVHHESGDAASAIGLYQAAIPQIGSRLGGYPYDLLGSALKSVGRTDDAIKAYMMAVQHEPRNAVYHYNLGCAWNQVDDLSKASKHFELAIQLKPNYSSALNNLGDIYLRQGDISRAQDVLQRAQTADIHAPLPWENLGKMHLQLGQAVEAEGMWRQALKLRQGGPSGPSRDVMVNLAQTLFKLHRYQEAVDLYNQVISLSLSLHTNRTSNDGFEDEKLLVHLATRDHTVAHAISHAVDALQMTADWRQLRRRFAVLQSVLKTQLHSTGNSSSSSSSSGSRSSSGPKVIVTPFQALRLPISSSMFTAIAKEYAKYFRQRAQATLPASLLSRQAVDLTRSLTRHMQQGQQKKRESSGGSVTVLRVGYVSSDFGDHPLGFLTRHIYRQFNGWRGQGEAIEGTGSDTAIIQTYCYATENDGRHDESSIRRGIMEQVTAFRPRARNSTTSDIAVAIVEDKIDILVNLNGYTDGALGELFELRLAPIQVLLGVGYAGTMGSNNIDYFVADPRTILPGWGEPYFTERMVYMSASYQANAHALSTPAQTQQDIMTTWTDREQVQRWRQHFGLWSSSNSSGTSLAQVGITEDNIVVYACHNQLYKIDDVVFTAWMSILQQVDTAVLWLLQPPQPVVTRSSGGGGGGGDGDNDGSSRGSSRHEIEARIRARAQAAGVDPARIIFAPRVDHTQHLLRLAVADVSLDPFTVNSHTTGTDSLFAGTPLLTWPGDDKMASRVGASLLHACQLDTTDVVVPSVTQYIQRAIELGLDKDGILTRVRRLLRRVPRSSLPLFDAQSWRVELYGIWQTLGELATLSPPGRPSARWHVF